MAFQGDKLFTAGRPRPSFALWRGGEGARGRLFIPNSQLPTPDSRRGFTLIELMVVIAIIGILAGMLTVAGFAFVGRAQEAATATTIGKADEAILERVSSINRWLERPFDKLMKDWNQRQWLGRWQTQYGVAPAILKGDTPATQNALLLLARKEAMKESFPITQDELKNCFWFWAQFDGQDGVVGISNAGELGAMNTFLLDIDTDQPGSQTLDRPGEIFFYALLNAPVFGGLPMVRDEFAEEELIDGYTINGVQVPADGVPELGDPWGNPLLFYRWPTRLVNNGEPFNTTPNPSPIPDVRDAVWTDNVPQGTLMPNAPNQLKQDPDDPLGRLASSVPAFGSNVGVTAVFHDAYTWHAPLIVSAGPDGEYGLEEPDVSLPIDINGNTVHRFGLARPLSTTPPTSLPPVKIAGGYTAPDPASEPFDEYLFDNITNHTTDGGL